MEKPHVRMTAHGSPDAPLTAIVEVRRGTGQVVFQFDGEIESIDVLSSIEGEAHVEVFTLVRRARLIHPEEEKHEDR